MATTDITTPQEGKQEKTQESTQKLSPHQGGDLAAAQTIAAQIMKEPAARKDQDSGKRPHIQPNPYLSYEMGGPYGIKIKQFYDTEQFAKNYALTNNGRVEEYLGDKGKESLITSRETEKKAVPVPEKGSVSSAFQKSTGEGREK